MIPQQNLSRLSNRLAEDGGQRIPEAVLEKDYCLAWFLAALTSVPLRHCLAFKGGTALKHCYFEDYRFSEDLDFTLVEEMMFDDILKELESVFAEAGRASGIVFRFVRQDRHSHVNSHTFYIGYEGPLPATVAGKELKVDITIKEKLVFPLEDRLLLRQYDEYVDLPEDVKVKAYSLHEIAAEKVVALMDRARNEPRDLYDVWHLVLEGGVSLGDLSAAVEEKLVFRGKKLDEVRQEFSAKEPRYRKLWQTRLAAQMSHLPEFESVYRAVQRELRQAGFIKRRMGDPS